METGNLRVLDVLGLVSLSFTAALPGAVVPGPVFVIVVSEALKKGKKAGPVVVLGHFGVEVFIVLTVFLGLDILLGSSKQQHWSVMSAAESSSSWVYI